METLVIVLFGIVILRSITLIGSAWLTNLESRGWLDGRPWLWRPFEALKLLWSSLAAIGMALVVIGAIVCLLSAG